MIKNQNVFVSGSIGIKKMPRPAAELLDDLMSKNARFIIGDAFGADKIAQDYLQDKKYKNVCIYFSGENPRNNIGNWNTKNIPADGAGRTFHTFKDIALANDADVSIMIWDGKSTGTLNNIKNMQSAKKRYKICIENAVIDDKYFSCVGKINR